MTKVKQNRVVSIIVEVNRNLTSAAGHLCEAGKLLSEIKENKLWGDYSNFGAFCRANFPNINISTINGLINQHKMYEVTISTKPEIAERIALMSKQAAENIPVKASKEQIVEIAQVATKDGTVTPTKKMVNEAIKTVNKTEPKESLKKDISLSETETVTDGKSKLKPSLTDKPTQKAEIPAEFNAIDIDKVIKYVGVVNDLAAAMVRMDKTLDAIDRKVKKLNTSKSDEWEEHRAKIAAGVEELRIAGLKSLKEALEYMKLDSEAGPKVIKATYKAMARQMHPDLGGSNEAMVKLNESLEVIKCEMGAETWDFGIRGY